VLDHLEENSADIRHLLSISSINYDEIRDSFLKIKKPDTTVTTDPLVKQVYFPVDGGYHLLSLLTPSGLLCKAKERIDTMRFSDEAKEAREFRNGKEKKHHEVGFSDIPNLTETAYGGTKPQNISVLNSNRNRGRAYLLPSLPPQFDSRQVRLPKSDFFKETLNSRKFKDAFAPLHRLLITDKNNIKIRTSIQKHIQEIVMQGLYQVHAVREQGTRSHGLGWSETEYFENLPKPQKIWLDDANLDTRQLKSEWLHTVLSDLARWIVNTYKYLFKHDAVDLSDDELNALRNMIEEVLFEEGEIFQ
jgi:CRISPR-associated protein Csy1